MLHDIAMVGAPLSGAPDPLITLGGPTSGTSTLGVSTFEVGGTRISHPQQRVNPDPVTPLLLPIYVTPCFLVGKTGGYSRGCCLPVMRPSIENLLGLTVKYRPGNPGW